MTTFPERNEELWKYYKYKNDLIEKPTALFRFIDLIKHEIEILQKDKLLPDSLSQRMYLKPSLCFQAVRDIVPASSHSYNTTTLQKKVFDHKNSEKFNIICLAESKDEAKFVNFQVPKRIQDIIYEFTSTIHFTKFFSNPKLKSTHNNKFSPKRELKSNQIRSISSFVRSPTLNCHPKKKIIQVAYTPICSLLPKKKIMKEHSNWINCDQEPISFLPKTCNIISFNFKFSTFPKLLTSTDYYSKKIAPTNFKYLSCFSKLQKKLIKF